MRTSISMHKRRYETSTRIHIIVIYVLIAILTLTWGVYLAHLSRTIRSYITELDLMKQRLSSLESTQITISSSVNGYDPLQRQSRHARMKSKLLNKQQEQDPDLLFGAIHFQVPVRRERF
jgi:DNA-binding transcriptional MocR family regulator